MSRQFTDFLERLATDQELADKFKKDKEGTMKAEGISEEHSNLVIKKNYDEIQNIVGDEYDLNKNDIIWAKKK